MRALRLRWTLPAYYLPIGGALYLSPATAHPDTPPEEAGGETYVGESTRHPIEMNAGSSFSWQIFLYPNSEKVQTSHNLLTGRRDLCKQSIVPSSSSGADASHSAAPQQQPAPSSMMEQPMKHRPKSAPVITNAYVQNKKEDECLCVRLDSLHYQRHASLIRLNQAVSDVVRQRKNLLTQRAITHQSSLDHVMDEIHTYKKDKHRPGHTRSHLPASTELYMEHGISSKWPPSPFCLPSVGQMPSHQRKAKLSEEASDRIRAEASDRRREGASDRREGASDRREGASDRREEASDRFTRMDDAKAKSNEHVQKHERKVTVASSERRRPQTGRQLLTYKELSQIACLENISMRAVEKQREQKEIKRQQLNRSMDSALQERVHRFLRKLE
ncbi:uncharacterized protein [Ranitomeya imitator]|uniref:uncharacterized protein n=1 Tax=Ranitomeya imitator TaxID=111125 RepID=UPI0037E793DE